MDGVLAIGALGPSVASARRMDGEVGSDPGGDVELGVWRKIAIQSESLRALDAGGLFFSRSTQAACWLARKIDVFGSDVQGSQ